MTRDEILELPVGTVVHPAINRYFERRTDGIRYLTRGAGAPSEHRGVTSDELPRIAQVTLPAASQDVTHSTEMTNK